MTMSLCFEDAYRAMRAGVITEEAYRDHLIAHFRGVRHAEDSRKPSIGSSLEPFGNSIREMILDTDFPITQDTELYEKLFCHCLTGSLNQVKLDIEQLTEYSLPVPLQPLATLAASKAHAEILQFCLDKGSVFDNNLDNASYDGAVSPSMLDVLLAANWQNLQQSKSIRNSLVNRAASRDVKMLIWLLDHGAKVSHETIKTAAHTGTPVPTMALLVEKCGVAALKGSGALQYAAVRGERDMVEFLLHIGVEVDEMPPNFGDIREPGPMTALYEAVKGQHVEVVQLLIEHGAKADRPCGWHFGRTETPLQAAKQLGNSQIVNLLQ